MKTRRKRKKPDLEAMLCAIGVPSDMRIYFSMIGVVEDELETAGLKWAEAAPGVSLFYALRPSELFAVVRSLDVYRSHVRELIARYVVGEKLEPGTGIEVSLAILGCSKLAPLNRLGLSTLALAAAGTPLEKYLGDRWAELERFEGQAATEFEIMRRKLTVSDRVSK